MACVLGPVQKHAQAEIRTWRDKGRHGSSSDHDMPACVDWEVGDRTGRTGVTLYPPPPSHPSISSHSPSFPHTAAFAYCCHAAPASIAAPSFAFSCLQPACHASQHSLLIPISPAACHLLLPQIDMNKAVGETDETVDSETGTGQQ